jgi:hypothetical protein
MHFRNGGISGQPECSMVFGEHDGCSRLLGIECSREPYDETCIFLDSYCWATRLSSWCCANS